LFAINFILYITDSSWSGQHWQLWIPSKTRLPFQIFPIS